MFDKTAKSVGKEGSEKNNSDEVDTTLSVENFDMSFFDELVHLAKNQPSEFETLRAKLCHELIQSAPERMRKRLLGLQFTIDMQRKTKSSALSSCLKLSSMMHDSLHDLQVALSNYRHPIQETQNMSAEIIPLFQNT